jgi:hypothetical protein
MIINLTMGLTSSRRIQSSVFSLQSSIINHQAENQKKAGGSTPQFQRAVNN